MFFLELNLLQSAQTNRANLNNGVIGRRELCAGVSKTRRVFGLLGSIKNSTEQTLIKKFEGPPSGKAPGAAERADVCNYLRS